jgi:hypothetical protein
LTKGVDSGKIFLEVAEMDLDTIEKQLAVLNGKLGEAWGELRVAQERVSGLVKKVKRLEDKRDRQRIASSGEIDYSLILKQPQSSVVYEKAKEWLASLGLRQNGYWTDTDETGIEIALTKGDRAKTLDVFDGLSLILPHITPNEEGLKRIQVFEHSLGLHGCYYLVVSDGDVTVQCIRFHSVKDEVKFPDLMSALIHCEEHLWYDGGKDE